MTQATILDSVPDELKAHIKNMGRIEWGATEIQTAEQHAQDMRRSVELTAKHFATGDQQQMHGCYIDGTDVVLCHTGTSPNSPNNARIIVGLWNWLIDQMEEQK